MSDVDGNTIPDRLIGRIQRLPVDELGQPKGYGFIRSEDGRDWFFHCTELTGDRRFEDLQAGEAVTFTPTEGPQGKLRANQVHPHLIYQQTLDEPQKRDARTYRRR